MVSKLFYNAGKIIKQIAYNHGSKKKRVYSEEKR